MNSVRAITLCIATFLTVGGCSKANYHLREDSSWAMDLTYDQFCYQAVTARAGSDKFSVMRNEYVRRNAITAIDVNHCRDVGIAMANRLAASQKAFNDVAATIGDIAGTALGVAAIGAAGYYGSNAGTQPGYQMPTPRPVPPVAPYVPPAPIPKALLTREPDTRLTGGIYMVTCRYAASATVIRVPMHEPCPESVPN